MYLDLQSGDYLQASLVLSHFLIPELDLIRFSIVLEKLDRVFSSAKLWAEEKVIEKYVK